MKQCYGNRKQLCYFGSTITNNCCTEKIKRKIALDKQDFYKENNLLTDKRVGIEAKKLFCTDVKAVKLQKKREGSA